MFMYMPVKLTMSSYIDRIGWEDIYIGWHKMRIYIKKSLK